MIGGWKLVAAERLAEIERLRERITELEDRLSAENLMELKAARALPGVVMSQEPEEDIDTEWGVDVIGNRHRMPALTPYEQRQADALSAQLPG